MELLQHLRTGYYSIRNEMYPSYKVREMTRYLLGVFGDRPLVGVEIGVKDGHHASQILTHLNMECLYLVDPYLCYPGYSDLEYDTTAQEMVSQGLFDRCYVSCREYLHPWRDSIVFVRKKSEDALGDIPSGLDFVYIDGNHSYWYVLRDLHNYYPKVRSGGFIGGHDFRLSLGVSFAVVDFIREMGITVDMCSGGHHDWWIKK